MKNVTRSLTLAVVSPTNSKLNPAKVQVKVDAEVARKRAERFASK
jgi:hypothetical protein